MDVEFQNSHQKEKEKCLNVQVAVRVRPLSLKEI